MFNAPPLELLRRECGESIEESARTNGQNRQQLPGAPSPPLLSLNGRIAAAAPHRPPHVSHRGRDAHHARPLLWPLILWLRLLFWQAQLPEVLVRLQDLLDRLIQSLRLLVLLDLFLPELLCLLSWFVP